NYIRINDRPLVLIYRPGIFPDINRSTEIWREVCRKEGVGEIYLAFAESFELVRSFKHPTELGFDAAVEFAPHGMSAPIDPPGKILNSSYDGKIHDYQRIVLEFLELSLPGHTRFRTVMPSWDNTPRRQDAPVMFENCSPGAYQAWLEA